MSRAVHARVVNGKWMYRDWSTTRCRYSTDPLSEEQMYHHMLDSYGIRDMLYGLADLDIWDHLQRARTAGSSEANSLPVDINGPWEAETCSICNSKHHVYVEDGKHLCIRCGESPGNKAHSSACE